MLLEGILLSYSFLLYYMSHNISSTKCFFSNILIVTVGGPPLIRKHRRALFAMKTYGVYGQFSTAVRWLSGWFAELSVRPCDTPVGADHLPWPAREGSDGSLHRHQTRWESLIRPFAANSCTSLHRAQITGADAFSPKATRLRLTSSVAFEWGRRTVRDWSLCTRAVRPAEACRLAWNLPRTGGVRILSRVGNVFW
jgi:hypothetical protein